MLIHIESEFMREFFRKAWEIGLYIFMWWIWVKFNVFVFNVDTLIGGLIAFAFSVGLMSVVSGHDYVTNVRSLNDPPSVSRANFTCWLLGFWFAQWYLWDATGSGYFSEVAERQTTTENAFEIRAMLMFLLYPFVGSWLKDKVIFIFWRQGRLAYIKKSTDIDKLRSEFLAPSHVAPYLKKSAQNRIAELNDKIQTAKHIAAYSIKQNLHKPDERPRNQTDPYWQNLLDNAFRVLDEQKKAQQKPASPPPHPTFTGAIKTEAEALELLGMVKPYTLSELKEQRRKFMHKIHPDQGGSNMLARLVNDAFEILKGKI